DEARRAFGSAGSSAAFNAASKLVPWPSSGRAATPLRNVVMKRVVGRAAVTIDGADASSRLRPSSRARACLSSHAAVSFETGGAGDSASARRAVQDRKQSGRRQKAKGKRQKANVWRTFRRRRLSPARSINTN